MMDHETIDKLQSLRLRTMAQVFRELVDKPEEGLTFAEKVGMMVDREWVERDNRRTGRRVKEAKFPVGGSIEEVVADATRGLDKAVLRSLGTCSWVRAKQNVIVIGATGVGKSFLACALANTASVMACARSTFECHVWFISFLLLAPTEATRASSVVSLVLTSSCSTTFSSHR